MYTDNYQLSLGATRTGLALKAALVDTAGTIHATARDLAGIIELGHGVYSFQYANHPDGYRGSIIFYTGALGGAANFSGVTIEATGDVSPESAGIMASTQSFINSNPDREYVVNPLDGYSSVIFRIDEKVAVRFGSNGYMTSWTDQSVAPLAITITSPPRVVPDNGGEVIFEFNHSGAGQFVDIAGLSIDRRAFTMVFAFEPHSLFPADADSDEEVLLGSTSDGLVVWMAASFSTCTIRISGPSGYGNATSYFPRNKPTNVLIISGDAAEMRVMLNGQGGTEAVMPAGIVTGFRLGGRTPTAAGPWRGRVRDFAVRSAASSWAEMSQINARLHAKHRIPPIIVNTVVLGDSLSVGLHPTAVTDRNIIWPTQVIRKPGHQLRNYSQSGMKASQIVGASYVQVFASFSGATLPAGAVTIVIIDLGSNDLAVSDTVANLVTNLSTISDQCRTYMGAAAVIVKGVRPRNPFSRATLDDLHAQLKALVGVKFDEFINPFDDPIYNLNDSTNTFRFAGDSTHTNSNGQMADARLTLPKYDRIVDRILGDLYDASNAVRNKLPSKSYLTGTNNSDGDVQLNEATGVTFPADFNNLTRANIATAVEQQILDDADSRAVLQAIVDKINAADPNLAGLTISAIAQGVRDVLLAGAAANGLGDYIAKIRQKTDNLPATPANNADVLTRMPQSLYVAPDNTAIQAAQESAANAESNSAQAVSLIGTKLPGVLTPQTINTYLVTQHGNGSWQTGTGGGGGLFGAMEVVLTFLDSDQTPIPFANFVVQGIGSGKADSSGVATIGLDPGQYDINVSPYSGAIWPTVPIIVDAINPSQSFDVVANSSAVGIPTVPGMTRVFATLRKPNGEIDTNARLTFSLVSAPSGNVDSWLLGEFDIRAKRSGSQAGMVIIDLPIGATYNVSRGAGTPLSVLIGAGPTQQLQQINEGS
jgi:hypothetical protein